MTASAAAVMTFHHLGEVQCPRFVTRIYADELRADSRIAWVRCQSVGRSRSRAGQKRPAPWVSV